MLRFAMKLAAYGLFGYATYEFVRGMVGSEAMQGVSRIGDKAREWGEQAREKGQDMLQRAREGVTEAVENTTSGEGRGQNGRSGARTANMTGPGKGRTVATEDATGESVPHKVGRGVIS